MKKRGKAGMASIAGTLALGLLVSTAAICSTAFASEDAKKQNMYSEYYWDNQFHEGRMNLMDTNCQYGLWIDETGHVIYQIGNRKVKGDGYETSAHGSDSGHKISDLIDGAAFFNCMVTDEYNEEYSAAFIIDGDGNELCHFFSGANNNYAILGRAGDAFVVVDERKGMDFINSWIFTVDRNGKIITEPREIPSDFAAGGSYDLVGLAFSDREKWFMDLGDDIFLLGGYGFYNVKTGALIRSASNLDDRSVYGHWENRHFVDHKLFFVKEDPEVRSVVVIDSSELTEDNNNAHFRTKAPEGAEFQLGKYLFTWKDKNVSGVMELEGNKLDFLDPYTGYQNIRVGLSDDEAYLYITFAADSRTYAVMFDENGKAMYDPVEIGAFSRQIEGGTAGYLLTDDKEMDEKFIYPDGTLHYYGEDLSAMNGLTFADVSENYWFVRPTDAGAPIDEYDMNEYVLYKLDGTNEVLQMYEADENTKYPDVSNFEETIIPEIEAKL